MIKEKQELIAIDDSKYNQVVSERECTWIKKLLFFFGLSQKDMDIAFSENLRKWQECADMHKIVVLRLPNGTIEISKSGEKYTWQALPVIQKKRVVGKKYALFIWTEPSTET